MISIWEAEGFDPVPNVESFRTWRRQAGHETWDQIGKEVMEKHMLELWPPGTFLIGCSEMQAHTHTLSFNIMHCSVRSKRMLNDLVWTHWKQHSVQDVAVKRWPGWRHTSYRWGKQLGVCVCVCADGVSSTPKGTGVCLRIHTCVCMFVHACARVNSWKCVCAAGEISSLKGTGVCVCACLSKGCVSVTLHWVPLSCFLRGNNRLILQSTS